MAPKELRTRHMGRRDPRGVRTSARRGSRRGALVLQWIRQHRPGLAAQEARHPPAHCHRARRAHLHRSNCALCRRARLRRDGRQGCDGRLHGRDGARRARHQHSELCRRDYHHQRNDRRYLVFAIPAFRTRRAIGRWERRQSEAQDMNISTKALLHRRQFVGAAAATAVQLGMIGSATAQSDSTSTGQLPVIKPGPYTSFGSLKQIEAGLLNISYAEAGPADGPCVILLHGWPYDIHSFVDVAPLLASAGYRVLVPYLRGYGATRFLSNETMRNGQPSALATDVIDFMDALKIQKATLAGFDWGARSANIVAALWPERVRAMVFVSGYLIGNQEAGRTPLPPKAELEWWYQFYFATERGRLGYDKYRREFS